MTSISDTRVVERWLSLVNRLAVLTETGVTAWKPTSDDDVFHLRVGPNTVAFTAHSAGRNSAVYKISILNFDGEVVDVFSDADIDPTSLAGPKKKLRDMHVRIARHLNGADEILTQILDKLPPDPDDDIPF